MKIEIRAKGTWGTTSRSYLQTTHCLLQTKSSEISKETESPFWTSKREPMSCCVTPELVEFSSGLNQYCCNLHLNSKFSALKQSIVFRIIFCHSALRLVRTFFFWENVNYLQKRISEKNVFVQRDQRRKTMPSVQMVQMQNHRIIHRWLFSSSCKERI